MNPESSIRTWNSGTVNGDVALGYDTGVNGPLKVYLYDTVNNEKVSGEVLYTRSNNGIIYNMIPGETYYWEDASNSGDNGLVEATGKRRVLNTYGGGNSGVRNTRDLGGMPVDLDNDGTIDGYTKYEKIYRGEKLYKDQSNVTNLRNLGITKEMDLRSDGEAGSDVRISENDRYNIQHYLIDTTKTSQYNGVRKAVSDAMQFVVDGESIYFHCTYGADRTGTLAYLLEGLLGVCDEDRQEDFELTTFFGGVERHRYFDTDIKNVNNNNAPKWVYMMNIETNGKSMSTTEGVYEWFMAGSTNQEEDVALVAAFRNKMINYIP